VLVAVQRFLEGILLFLSDQLHPHA
jgi:hypothetical protein